MKEEGDRGTEGGKNEDDKMSVEDMKNDGDGNV